MFKVLKEKKFKVTSTTSDWLSMWKNEKGRYCIGYINLETGIRVVHYKGSKYYIEGLWKKENIAYIGN
jgi:hypothetical protein